MGLEVLPTPKRDILFYVNGSEIYVERPDPEMTLQYFLRNILRLTGTKLGCGEGGCGACTVMVSHYNFASDQVQHHAVNACLAPLCAMDGKAITTVEGIGSTKTAFHPCQERIARAHGSQCGFCTPGFVMSMYTLIRNQPNPTEEEIENAFDGNTADRPEREVSGLSDEPLSGFPVRAQNGISGSYMDAIFKLVTYKESGNLCRCTGYRAILEGYKTFSKGYCCKGAEGRIKCCQEGAGTARECVEGSSVLFDASKLIPLDPTQELIFPAALKLRGPPKLLLLQGPRVQWYRPTTLQQLLELRDRFPQHNQEGKPQHRLVAGNTEIGVDVKFKGALYEVLIHSSHVPELNQMELKEEGLLVGAAVTLTQLAAKLKDLQKTLPEYQTRAFAALLEMLRWFGGQQIRNVASIGGNIINASPISDLNPTLMAVGSKLHLACKGSQRTVALDSSFFVGYKQTALQPNEVLISTLIPFTRENEFVYSYKQARRRQDDIAIVNAGMRVLLEPSSPHWVVRECTLCYGGMSYRTVMANKTQLHLVGKPWCEPTLTEAYQLLSEDLPLAPDAPGGMVEYRKSLVTAFFFKFYLSVLSRVSTEPLPPELENVTQLFSRQPVRSTQGFQRVPGTQLSADVVGRPVMHLSALMQATGEARYTDDIPPAQGELYAALVLSTHAHAEIAVDACKALEMEGVKDFVSVKDVPGSNITGGLLSLQGTALDEQVFVDGVVTQFGQVIGVVVAENQPLAQRAAQAVKITYQDLPSVITIQDAIAAKQFFPTVHTISQGDVDSALTSAEHLLEGEIAVGGQDHFYMETIACVVTPRGEDGEMEIVASTQGLAGTQTMAARALGVPDNRVVAKARRIGGGFGGKETRTFYLTTAIAVAAHKVQAAVRIMLDRNENMRSSGGRHPFLAKYKIGFTSEGRVTGLDLQLYSNGGSSLDLSQAVMDRAITHADNVYNLSNVRITGQVCRTNIPPNTAFRGFGAPQAMLVSEHLMEDVATFLRLSPDKVRALNFYKDGDVTPFGQAMPQCHIRRCWQELINKSQYNERRIKTDNFNKSSRWKKRGIAINPTKYGVAFGRPFLNKGGALLHVYTDGSVLLTHGGMEMGQGLHTKMVQVCARCLEIPPESIHIMETSTDTVPNASPTAASSSTDIYGMAVKDCCDQLMERLKPYMVEDPKAGWKEWVKRAYYDRVNLSVQGFYLTPDLDFDWATGRGRSYNYFSYGASCSEVEIDILTGDFSVLRTDLLMDVGDSLNPAIDIGQVEGAFAQGLGLFTLEQCVRLEGNQQTQRGQLLTTGPGAYKIPSSSDVPVEFNVSLMDRTPNPRAIFSSKAVGEPPLFLAASVFFAIKDAIAAARAEEGLTGMFKLDSPATCERIRMACADQFTEQTLRYFEQLKSSPDGWKVCTADFTQRLHSDDHVRFFCLQVLEYHARTRHASSSDDDILALRKVLMTWLQPSLEGAAAEKSFVKNKMAQIFALVFVVDYPLKWPLFFSELLLCVQSLAPSSVELYLRILLAIDEEVVDRQIIHSPEENSRNTAIKDTMREQCVPDLVESWLQIMTAFAQLQPMLTSLAMEVVGAYVSWIEISLIANDRFVGLLLQYLSVPSLRESAADCLHEIVSKGMDPKAKTELVESLCKVLESAGVLSSTVFEDVDVDFQVKLSRLIGGIGCALITSWNKLVKAGEEESAALALQAIESKLPYMHRYLSDEDDGVSENMISFAVQYIGVLKHHSNLSDNDRANLQALVYAVITKLKYDEEYNFLNEGEEEVLFLEYRRQLKVLFDNIAQLEPHLMIHTAKSVLTSTLASLSSEPFMNVEVALRVFYLLGEVISDKQFGAPNVANSPWHQMMTTEPITNGLWAPGTLNVMQSQVCHYSHTVVLLQYYETVVRYERFFQLETQYIANVMENFLGNQGLRHTNCSVRSRLCYLFVRFTKAVKNQLGPMAGQILKNLQDLLFMLPGSPENKGYLSGNDLIFLYEAAGVLIAFSLQPPEGKKALMTGLLAPILEKFPVYLAELGRATVPSQQEELAQALNHLLSFGSRASKVFTSHQQAKQSGCLQCFAEALPVFLHGLEVSSQRELLHSGVRQYLHRMVICLGDELLKYVPMAVSLLLKDCKSHDIQEFIPLINQLVTKYKERILPFLLEIFMPVVHTIVACLNQPFDANDTEEHRDRQNLQKAYFLFISSIASNNVTSVISSQGSQNLEEVLGTLVQGAVGFPDPAVQKICFGVLKKLVDAWGSEGVLPGFVEYMYKHILPACFLAPLRTSFDLNDGYAFLTLGEIAGVLKGMVAQRGAEVIVYLQNEYLPSLNMPSELIQDFLQNIQQLEIKVLKPYLKVLFAQFRTATPVNQ